MKEQLITFETAKLAKEKGFGQEKMFFSTSRKKDVSIPFYYVGDNIKNNGQHGLGTLCPFYKDGILDYISIPDIANDFTNYFYAPTQSLLQKWLRENYDIFVSINTTTGYFCYSDDPGDAEYLPVHKFRIIKNINNFKYEVIEWSSSYETYEESLEKGLQEALKLI